MLECVYLNTDNNNAVDTWEANEAVGEALARNSKFATEIFASVYYFWVNF